MICKISVLFVNQFTADNGYSLLNRGNLLQHFKMQLAEKPKEISQFFSEFAKLRFNFEHFQKKLTLTTDVFLNLGAPKNVVR